MRRLVTIAVLMLCVGVSAAAGQTETDYWRLCGGTVKAHNLSCRKARGIGRLYFKGLENFISRPSPKGFKCNSRRVSAKPVVHVACRRERGHRIEQVRFFYEWGDEGA